MANGSVMTVNTPKAKDSKEDRAPKTAQPGPRKKNKSLLMTPGGEVEGGKKIS